MVYRQVWGVNIGKQAPMVSRQKGCKGFVGKDRVFILTGYVSHADIYKIESLGIDGMFVNSKGKNGIIREIEGYVKGTDRDQ